MPDPKSLDLNRAPGHIAGSSSLMVRMNSRKKKILLIIGIVCVIPAAFFTVSSTVDLYRFFNPYLDEEIAGATAISSEWQDVVSKRPLRVERQIQMIVLDLDRS